MVNIICDLITIASFSVLWCLTFSGWKKNRQLQSKCEIQEVALKDISARVITPESCDIKEEEADDIHAFNRRLISDVRWMRSRADSALDHIRELGL